MCGKGLMAAVVLATTVIAIGCRKSDSGTSAASKGSSPPPAALTGDEKAAADALMAQVKQHWSRTADGFVSVYNSGNAYLPAYLRELRDISVAAVEPRQLSAREKAGGTQWSAVVRFQPIQCREAGEPGMVLGDGNSHVMRSKGRWSQWVDLTPEPMLVEKVGGKWKVQQQTMLLAGSQPTSADYQAAGLKGSGG